MEIFDIMTELAYSLMSSRWVYVVILASCWFDAVIPAFPAESLLIAAGVAAAATGSPNMVLIFGVGVAGAMFGDHTSYAIGRSASGPLQRWMLRGRRTQRGLAWAQDALDARGGLVLVTARYLPGGRTATTLTMGATRFPLPRFTRWDALAGVLWSAYTCSIGFLFGTIFQDNLLLGVASGIGFAIVVAALIETVLRRREAARRAQVDAA